MVRREEDRGAHFPRNTSCCILPDLFLSLFSLPRPVVFVLPQSPLEPLTDTILLFFFTLFSVINSRVCASAGRVSMAPQHANQSSVPYTSSFCEFFGTLCHGCCPACFRKEKKKNRNRPPACVHGDRNITDFFFLKAHLTPVKQTIAVTPFSCLPLLLQDNSSNVFLTQPYFMGEGGRGRVLSLAIGRYSVDIAIRQFCTSHWTHRMSLTMKMRSNRDKMVVMRSMFSAALLRSS